MAPTASLHDERFDEPAAMLRRVVVVAAQGRTGSHLVCAAFAGTGLLGVPGEYLSPIATTAFRDRLGVPCPSLVGHVLRAQRRLRHEPRWRDTARVTRPSLHRYLDGVRRLRTTANGTFGIKVHANEVAALRRAGLDLDVWGVPSTFVRLDRVDRVAQAVSFVRARLDGAFFDDALRAPAAKLVYDRDAIARAVEHFEAGARAWDRYFESRRISPVVVHYEDLDRDYASTIRRLLDELGHPDAPVPPAALARQRDELSDEWTARFLAGR